MLAAGGPLATSALAGDIDPALAAVMDGLDARETVSALLYLDEQVDSAALTAQFNLEKASLRARHREIVESLRDTAAFTQGPLLETIAELAARGQIERHEAFWIVNAVRVDASPAVIERLARRDDVGVAFLNPRIELVNPVEQLEEQKADAGGVLSGGPEPGVVAVRAPEAWALGYDGTGVLVSIIDTGTDGNHPALADRWAGLDPFYAGNPQWAWFDPFLGQNDFPYDGGSHGSHVMGSVVGGLPGDQVGVAPGAKWISAGAIDRGGGIAGTVADAIEAFQWIIDPDGNPATFADVPATCSNSWGLVTSHGYPACDELFWSFIDNCEAAGIVVLFAAGNEGFSGLRRPGDRATNDFQTMAIGSVNANVAGFPISSFSSRGPTNCTPDGSPAIKPEVSAPGDGVRSSVPGGGYAVYSGTSMATPHVNGVIAMMRQACPDLTVADIKMILYQTTVDLGPEGDDNDYGHGMIDAYEAVLMAESLCGPSPPRARDASYATGVGESLNITLVATDFDGEPGGPLTYRILSLPSAGGILVDAGTGAEITAGDLPYDLVANGDTVTYVPADGFYGTAGFSFAGDDGGEAPDGGEGDAATVSILVQFGAPSIPIDDLPTGYAGFTYGPYQIPVDQGQPDLTFSVVSDEYIESDLGSSLFEVVGADQNWNADDNTWTYTLPFSFPFYGQEYTQIWVSSNGFLNFDNGTSDFSNTTAELIAAVRIAPLWDDLRTDTGGDIFIESGADFVTIRWDTRTYSGGNQCNHACTLFADGRIEFHYGSGNTGLTPTIGVSAGDGERYLLASYDGAGSLGNVNSIEIFPPAGLPEGLQISTDGVMSGTPVAAGTSAPRVRVVDGLGRSTVKELGLVIEEGAPPCPGDFDGSGSIDTGDLLFLLAGWGTPAADIENSDGLNTTNVTDLIALLASWGDC
jgi:subtilisin family serine protease